MNIFIMILMTIFLGAYYLISAPSSQIPAQDATHAIANADLRAIAECASASHNARISGTDFIDICTTQHDVKSEFICLGKNLAITPCENENGKKPAYSYIVTTAAPIGENQYNAMMEIFDKYYADAGAFGLFRDNKITSGGTASKQIVPKAIIETMDIQPGQLVYMTQYELPDTPKLFAEPDGTDIECPAGSEKTFRFGRWQCIGYNLKSSCGGDMVWDSTIGECIPDESRKPLCSGKQTAVIVDEVWECIDPFNERQCPANMIARLNYNTLEWECVTDPNNNSDTRKCDNLFSGDIHSSGGRATLRMRTTSCTDCERAVTDTETCATTCIPDADKLGNQSCYPGDPRECSGANRAFYFGFPNAEYIANFTGVSGYNIPLDVSHSQNRRFNCMDCGDRGINTAKSYPPYIVVCN